jgi:hypothetical protein
MNNRSIKSKYTVEDHDGTWFQLWWDGDECIYSEDLKAHSRGEAEKEAAGIAATSSPVERVMHALGCETIGDKASDCQ